MTLVCPYALPLSSQVSVAHARFWESQIPPAAAQRAGVFTRGAARANPAGEPMIARARAPAMARVRNDQSTARRPPSSLANRNGPAVSRRPARIALDRSGALLGAHRGSA